MHLRDVIQALEENKIQVALDIGVHARCSIESNCPMAVELRKIIRESGVPLTQLMETYNRSNNPNPSGVPSFNVQELVPPTDIPVNIGGQRVVLNLHQVLGSCLDSALASKLSSLEGATAMVRKLGMSFHSTCINTVHELRRSVTLPQLELPLSKLISMSCTFTKEGSSYVFLFKREYKPEYLVTYGKRYKIREEVVIQLQRIFYITMYIDRGGKILRIKTLDVAGRDFSHYHGGPPKTYDCWGKVKLPTKWNGDLDELGALVNMLIGSLKTINLDSLMNREPVGMIDSRTLLNQAKLLGEEGKMDFETPANDTVPVLPRRWGTTTPRTHPRELL